ncbi:uncharacterized protein EI97DRAFT_448677 [Westerdykella ornata]|uniref:Monopolin complex subunit Csm1/Pcs1 C-terminal domain-containing protein n=1 Tax=Westerdykella ornata TaxID=318751 RepID=A0A6A6JRG6_WESOR|nr:uncharacterized protein EI97DRAFT_448677 [Westerdykella ornata]KAF2278864.1 hypothetical protein EI97DRAFT_448677 [Westerdykella ornata]
MPPRNTRANISFTVDSASEDEMARDTFPTPDSNTENKEARRGRGRPPAKAAEASTKTKAATKKAKPAARRASGGSVLGVRKQGAGVAKKSGHRGRAERKVEGVSETEEVDEFDGEVAPVEETKPVTRRGRPAKVKKAEEEEEEEEKKTSVAVAVDPSRRTRKAAEPAIATKKNAAKAKSSTTSKTSKRAPKEEPKPEPEEAEMTIQETQAEPVPPEPMDIEDSIEALDEIPESMPPPPRSTARRPVQSRSRQPSAGPRRAGSVSDTERGDPALRRKVGDLTKKLDAMTAKYENLRELATSQRESNFEQLKRRTEQVAKNQDGVIKALKQQVSDMQSRSTDLSAAKKELAKLQKENSRLEAENKTLTASLDGAQKEIKTLSTKLAAARSSAPTDKVVPGSAVKAARPTGVVLPGAVEAAKEAQQKQLKLDLYSDLTNLVVLNCKKGEEGEDVFDCLQTGRNGTLHFQLSILNDEENYGDAQFVYTPLLDEKRDAGLLDLLPDYLTDELEFPRNQVAKFYEKVAGSMSRAVELVE